MDKVTTLSEAETFEVKEKKDNEMKLVDVSEFAGKIADPITDNDLEEIYSLAQEMIKFAHARGGAGLALPQIGINKRGFVFLSGDDKWEMIINPEYFPNDKKKAIVYERSLSYDGVYALPRYKKIMSKYNVITIDKHDRLCLSKVSKMMSGLRAFMFQSLTDILNGKIASVQGFEIKEEAKKE